MNDGNPIDPRSVHPHCVVCGPDNPCGLALHFVPSSSGTGVRAVFECAEPFQGYTGLLHGGVVSAVLDGAMAHCLFRLGRVGHTGSLQVRFRHPILVGKTASVEARLELSRGRLHVLSARLEQEGTIKAEASARFVETPASA